MTSPFSPYQTESSQFSFVDKGIPHASPLELLSASKFHGGISLGPPRSPPTPLPHLSPKQGLPKSQSLTALSKCIEAQDDFLKANVFKNLLLKVF